MDLQQRVTRSVDQRSFASRLSVHSHRLALSSGLSKEFLVLNMANNDSFSFGLKKKMGNVYTNLFAGNPTKVTAEVNKTVNKIRLEAQTMVRKDFHRFELMKTTWDVPKRYTDLKFIGCGSYGQVCSALDQKTKLRVAIKKFSNPFFCDIAGKRTYREIMLLKFMDHDNVVNLTHMFTPCLCKDTFRDLYVVMPLMKMDLRTMINDHKSQLNKDAIRLIVYQILKGLQYIHSTGIIHRDLKPGNIAVDEDFDLKILDLGLARNATDEAGQMTGYVFTRWYRAPEIILNWRNYTQTADLWSCGCIMAELFTGKVLFKGCDKLDQIDEIIKLLGKPNDEFLDKITSDARTYVQKIVAPSAPTDKLRKIMKKHGASGEAIDLVQQMLEIDPDHRLTSRAALLHPYFNQADSLFSPSIKRDVSSQAYDTSYEERELTTEEWRGLIFDEVVNFDPELLQRERIGRQSELPPFS